MQRQPRVGNVDIRMVNCCGLVTPVTKAWLVTRIEPFPSKAMFAGESYGKMGLPWFASRMTSAPAELHAAFRHDWTMRWLRLASGR